MPKPVTPRSVSVAAPPRPVPRAPKPVPAPAKPKAPKVQKPKRLYGVYCPGDEILQIYYLTRERFDTICRLLDAGMHVDVIAREHDVSRTTIHAIRTRELEGAKRKPAKPKDVVDWRRTMFQPQFDEYGLPATWPDINGIQRPRKPANLSDLYGRLQQLSRAELQHILDYQTLDGRGISMAIEMYVRNLLDCVHYDPKVRLAATKMVSDRVHGTALTRIGNPDGSAVNPLLALINIEAARLKPVDLVEVDDDDA